jgi:hypothetical protein
MPKRRVMGASFQTRLVLIGMALTLQSVAEARPYNYPQVRYQSAVSQSLGGVTLPLNDELGNNIFNNPAALAHNTKFRAEYLNLNLEANSNVLSSLGLSTTRMMGLGGMTETLNENKNKVFGAGLSNLTALSWGGLGVGLLLQERVRAVSDGTTARYETMSQIIPAAGYGLALARGVVRLGYSMQFINQASGIAQNPSDSGASFLKGINQGWGLSHTVSANFTFPFTYLPTFSLAARNIGGLHFNQGSIFSRANNPVGIPADEDMSVDVAMALMVRLSGTFKSHWYLQYHDLTSTSHTPVLEHLGVGANFDFTSNFSVRVGFTGNQPSAGIGFKSEASEISLAYYNEPNPFSGVDYWDTRYTLQYKIFFQDKNVRDRDREKSPKGQ